jgi:membrane protein YqaA with SNARE-associated domain
VLLFSATVLLVPTEAYESLGQYGYLGLFLVTLLASGGLVVPVPYLVLLVKAATILNPVAVALIAAVAAGLGEVSGYLIGLSGRDLLGNGRWQDRLREWIDRRGFLTVAVLAFLPNPAFDAAGITAGALGYPAWRFVAACTVGKAGRFLLLTLAGAQLWGIRPPL